eukprot:1207354-Amphidinium_carterae.2
MSDRSTQQLFGNANAMSCRLDVQLSKVPRTHERLSNKHTHKKKSALQQCFTEAPELDNAHFVL